MINIEWKEKTGRFQSGNDAYCGTIRVGSTHWGSSKTEGGPWVANVLLPGISIKQQYQNHMAEADARKMVEFAVRKWFKSCGAELDQ